MTGLTAEVVACIAKRVSSGKFAPPGDKGATIRIPVRFKVGGS